MHVLSNSYTLMKLLNIVFSFAYVLLTNLLRLQFFLNLPKGTSRRKTPRGTITVGVPQQEP
jgi:hypothetical protein